MAEHDMDSAEQRDRYQMSPETEAAWRGDEKLAAEGRRTPTVDDWMAAQKARRDIPAVEIAEEIAMYLPNPGQYQQLICGARAEGGTVVLDLVNGQEMLLRIVTEHNAE